MIIDSSELRAPWLVYKGEGKHILRLGFKGTGYRITSKEAERLGGLYKIIAGISLVSIISLMATAFYYVRTASDKDGLMWSLSYVMTFILINFVMYGLTHLFFVLAKRRLDNPVMIDDGPGYWVMQARAATSSPWRSTFARGFATVMIALFSLEAIFYGISPMNLLLPCAFGGIMIHGLCIRKFGTDPQIAY
jgi:hypothetical protein